VVEGHLGHVLVPCRHDVVGASVEGATEELQGLGSHQAVGKVHQVQEGWHDAGEGAKVVCQCLQT